MIDIAPRYTIDDVMRLPVFQAMDLMAARIRRVQALQTPGDDGGGGGRRVRPDGTVEYSFESLADLYAMAGSVR